MRTRALATATLVAFSVALSPAPARAQEKDAVTEMARQRFQEGVKFFDQKKYEEARAAFLQAYALKRHPAVLLNLAQSELRSAHPADASKHFAAFLRESPNASAIERGEAERGLNDARSKIGRLHITVNVSGADVFIDGEQVGQSPVADALEVTTGSHAVEARYNGRSAASTVNAPAGKLTNVPLSIEPAASSVAAVPPTPPAASPPPPAPPAEDATGTGPSDVSRESKPAEPEPTESSDQGANATTSSGREAFLPWVTHSPLGIGGAALTIIGLGAWVGFAIAGDSAGNSAQDIESQIKNAALGQPPGNSDTLLSDRRSNPCALPVPDHYDNPCQALRNNLDRQNTDVQYATIGAVVFGVGLATTVVGYVLTSKKGGAEPSSASLVPVFGPQGGGLAAVGSF